MSKRKDKTIGQNSPSHCYWCKKTPEEMKEEWTTISFQKGDSFNEAIVCSFSEECYFGIMNLSKALTDDFWKKLKLK